MRNPITGRHHAAIFDPLQPARIACAYIRLPAVGQNRAVKSGFAHAYTAIEGFRVHYVSGGAGQPVLLIRDGSRPAKARRRERRHDVPRRIPAIAVDPRGFGHSSRPEQGYDAGRVAAVLRDSWATNVIRWWATMWGCGSARRSRAIIRRRLSASSSWMRISVEDNASHGMPAPDEKRPCTF